MGELFKNIDSHLDEIFAETMSLATDPTIQDVEMSTPTTSANVPAKPTLTESPAKEAKEPPKMQQKEPPKMQQKETPKETPKETVKKQPQAESQALQEALFKISNLESQLTIYEKKIQDAESTATNFETQLNELKKKQVC